MAKSFMPLPITQERYLKYSTVTVTQPARYEFTCLKECHCRKGQYQQLSVI